MNPIYQFDTYDSHKSHPLHHQKKGKSRSNKLLFFLLSILTFTTFVILIYKSHRVSSLESTLSQQKEENQKLLSQNKQLSSYASALNTNHQEIFALEHKHVGQARTDGQMTEQEILDQIFWPHGSSIVQSLEELNLLRSWTGHASYHLVLKASEIGDSAETFRAHTRLGDSFLVLVKTKQGHRFGGYTSRNFNPTEYTDIDADVFKQDEDAFVFSLDKKERYEITNFEKAVHCDENIVIEMGEGDFIIKDNFFSKPSTTEFPKSFNSDVQLGLTAGEKEFMVEELEVFRVFHCLD
jgi:cell division protein FtsB